METFVLFKGNKIDQRYEISEEELVEKFQEWLEGQERDWLDYYASGVIRFFISLSIGLNSTPDDGQWPSITEVLDPIRKEYYKEHVYK